MFLQKILNNFKKEIYILTQRNYFMESENNFHFQYYALWTLYNFVEELGSLINLL